MDLARRERSGRARAPPMPSNACTRSSSAGSKPRPSCPRQKAPRCCSGRPGAPGCQSGSAAPHRADTPWAVRDRVHERRQARREVDGDEGAQGREVITGQQIRAARDLFGWTPYRLAPRAGIGHTLLRQSRPARTYRMRGAAVACSSGHVPLRRFCRWVEAGRCPVR